MKVHRKYLMLFFLLWNLVSLRAFAEANKTGPIEPKPEPTGFEKTLLDDHQTISLMVDDWATSLDRFLTGKTFVKMKNETKVVIESSNNLIEGKGVASMNNFSVNLRLPNTEKYWQLKFTNYDQQTTNRGVRGSYLKQSAGQRNYGATVGFLQSFDNVQFIFRPRILLEDPLNISHSIAFESSLKSKAWDFGPKLEFFASPDKGTGIFLSLNLGYKFNDTYSITFVNEGEYQERFHLAVITQGVSFGQIIDDLSSYSYNLFFVSTNHPNYSLEYFSPSVAYNHILYKDILDFQLVPALNFSRPLFHGVASFAVNLNFYF